ncbi:MAG: retroviral-like aspartic protease family protein [Nitrosomonas sp.]|jgi:clan AA aspartic protease (TIGR02281 family)|nr:retroviral-like aspartic protease family protein [Nitrosomonas sp.]MBP9101524.1 retroviral-like aspartic protease family protein [Nitrosomonas sp.]
MSIQDRDYLHRKRVKEKTQSTEQKAATCHSTQWPWKTVIRDIFCWTVLALTLLIVFQYFQSFNQPYAQPASNSLVTITGPTGCGALPQHGAAYLIDPSVMKRTDVLYAGLEIQNDYDHPMVAVLSDPAGVQQLLALSIHAGNSLQLSVPVGKYGMQVLVGSDWCNLATGFTDGAIVSVAGGISVDAGSTTSMQFSGSGLRPIQLALAYSQSQPASVQEVHQPAEVIGSGKMELKQTRDGHYFSSGTINGTPVVFMIDTGATIVSISSEIAARAGIRKCTPRQVTTANGQADACAAKVPELTFGSFRFTQVDVMVMPNMPGDALLGMNVLRNFRIEQAGKVMRIFAP